MGDVEFAVLVTRLEDDAYDLGEVAREIETIGQRIDETKAAMFAHVDSLRAENARLRAVVEKAGAAIGHAELWVDPLGVITCRPDAETTCKALFEYHTARAALDAKEG